tara:strand:+ start:439 stop:1083 length:645 start_codon:yes stop_codon:yes gene_type:complete
MDFLIDRKFWNLVKKQLSPQNASVITKCLSKKFFPNEFILNLPNKRISKGFIDKKCLHVRPLFGEGSLKYYFRVKDYDLEQIEIATIRTLIEYKGLSEKIKYCKKGNSDCAYVIDQLEEQEFDRNYYLTKKGFVYFIRNEEIYKIGITDNLLRRFTQIKPDEVLNVVRCTNYETLEKDLHKIFKANRIPQTEYFRLDKYQIEQVNIEMTTRANF